LEEYKNARFKLRAFVSCCFACGQSNVTLITFNPVMICKRCLESLNKNGFIDCRDGGIVRLVDKNNYIYIPPKPKEEQADGTQSDIQ